MWSRMRPVLRFLQWYSDGEILCNKFEFLFFVLLVLLKSSYTVGSFISGFMGQNQFQKLFESSSSIFREFTVALCLQQIDLAVDSLIPISLDAVRMEPVMRMRWIRICFYLLLTFSYSFLERFLQSFLSKIFIVAFKSDVMLIVFFSLIKLYSEIIF